MSNIDMMRVNAAMKRLPLQASASVEQVLANARRLKIAPLAAACQDELRLRGTLKLSAADAAKMARIGAEIEGKSLREATEIAFREVPATEDEIVILSWVALHPRTSFQDLAAIYGGNDLALMIGHLVHDRFGYFRPFICTGVQSDVLLTREMVAGHVHYTLRAEALAAFNALDILVD